MVVFVSACVFTSIGHSTSDERLQGLAVGVKPLYNNSGCDVRSVPAEQRCEYVRSHGEECGGDEGRINYLAIGYCWLGRWPAVAAAVICTWLLVIFTAMLVTAEHFFCPALEELSDFLGLPDHLAGATLMAFGNGASDVFTMVAALASDKNESGVSTALSEALSSGLFVSNVVLGAVLLFAPEHPVSAYTCPLHPAACHQASRCQWARAVWGLCIRPMHHLRPLSFASLSNCWQFGGNWLRACRADPATRPCQLLQGTAAGCGAGAVRLLHASPTVARHVHCMHLLAPTSCTTMSQC